MMKLIGLFFKIGVVVVLVLFFTMGYGVSTIKDWFTGEVNPQETVQKFGEEVSKKLQSSDRASDAKSSKADENAEDQKNNENQGTEERAAKLIKHAFD